LNFFAVFGERIISFFMLAVDNFDSTLFHPVSFVVADGDTVLFFEVILDRFRSKRQVRMEFRKDFNRNKLFVNIAVSRVVYPMTGMNLN